MPRKTAERRQLGGRKKEDAGAGEQPPKRQKLKPVENKTSAEVCDQEQKAKKTPVQLRYPATQNNTVHYVYKRTLGQNDSGQLRQCLQQPFVRSLSSYKLFRVASPFTRRVTCLEWHPTHPSTVAVGSKGGDIILWDYEVLNKTTLIPGKGAGDFIGCIKFSPTNSNRIFTVSGDGTLSLQEFGRTAQVFSRTADLCFWYCSLDVSASRELVVTGDNVGNALLLSTDGHKIWNQRLHKKKITHVEFNPRCDWLLATSSVDQTVRIWDIRNIKDKNSFLNELLHQKPVNSAYFNPTDGSRLLTTDQYDEVRLYTCANWSSPQLVINHPHRQFQHLTPIKATWHPLYDLAVVGRYPTAQSSAQELRTIDMFDTSTGKLVYQLYSSRASGIVSLNKFNPLGDTLASGMGFNILIWSHEDVVAGKQETLLTAMQNQDLGSNVTPRRHRQSEARSTELARRMTTAGTNSKTKTKDHMNMPKGKRL
ncbi:DDB2 protein, partial [Polypterus senegalus]|nr:DNA damage-binding protein 2 isoform X1 [Polypterus senegalus]XP_039610816.1 DNA damage-binding protein 2 isoform X1 [Polypterus senegalus]XP_039610825.1 DNA damage-binding protein 2 isoform X1 [Polypterus senegalus]MBN3292027.1 DDB2 protein [Polypterus senegalus]